MKKQKRYILLNVGELVKDGDEEYSPNPLDDVDLPDPVDDKNLENEIVPMEDCGYQWRPVAVEFIGEVVQDVDYPVRRELKK